MLNLWQTRASLARPAPGFAGRPAGTGSGWRWRDKRDRPCVPFRRGMPAIGDSRSRRSPVERLDVKARRKGRSAVGAVRDVSFGRSGVDHAGGLRLLEAAARRRPFPGRREVRRGAATSCPAGLAAASSGSVRHAQRCPFLDYAGAGSPPLSAHRQSAGGRSRATGRGRLVATRPTSRHPPGEDTEAETASLSRASRAVVAPRPTSGFTVDPARCSSHCSPAEIPIPHRCPNLAHSGVPAGDGLDIAITATGCVGKHCDKRGPNSPGWRDDLGMGLREALYLPRPPPGAARALRMRSRRPVSVGPLHQPDRCSGRRLIQPSGTALKQRQRRLAEFDSNRDAQAIIPWPASSATDFLTRRTSPFVEQGHALPEKNGLSLKIALDCHKRGERPAIEHHAGMRYTLVHPSMPGALCSAKNSQVNLGIRLTLLSFGRIWVKPGATDPTSPEEVTKSFFPANKGFTSAIRHLAWAKD